MPTQPQEIIRTRETLPKNAPKREANAKVALYLAAGALRSKPSRDPATQGWIVTTDWELIGENEK